jgi:hypothetical protein
MDSLQTRDLSLGRFSDRIRRPRSRRRISRSHAYPAESSRARESRRRFNGTSSRYERRRWRGERRRPCKSSTSFHLQSGRRVFQSKARVTSKQRLRVPRVHRGIVKLFFTRKNFPSNVMSMGRGYTRSYGRFAGVEKQYRSREARLLHSRRASDRSYRTSPLRRLQSRQILN